MESSIRQFIEDREGGLVDNPYDPGKITNHGISFRFLRTLHPEIADIDGDGDVDYDDIRKMTKAKAWAIFVDVLFIPSGIYLVHGKLCWALMDAAVNMGSETSVKLLQRVLNRLGAKCSIDGVIGPETIGVLSPLPKMWIVSEVLLERVQRYREIAEKNTALRGFFRGWLNRVVDLKQLIDSDMYPKWL